MKKFVRASSFIFNLNNGQETKRNFSSDLIRVRLNQGRKVKLRRSKTDRRAIDIFHYLCLTIFFHYTSLTICAHLSFSTAHVWTRTRSFPLHMSDYERAPVFFYFTCTDHERAPILFHFVSNHERMPVFFHCARLTMSTCPPFSTLISDHVQHIAASKNWYYIL